MLRVLTEAAAEKGAAWVTESGLVVGRPGLPDRPGTRPLEGHSPIVLPENRKHWSPIGAACDGPLSVETASGTLRIETLQTDPIPSYLVVFATPHAPRVMAQLPIGVTPCQALIADLGPTPGKELAAAWRIGETFGITVWSMPAKAATP